MTIGAKCAGVSGPVLENGPCRLSEHHPPPAVPVANAWNSTLRSSVFSLSLLQFKSIKKK